MAIQNPYVPAYGGNQSALGLNVATLLRAGAGNLANVSVNAVGEGGAIKVYDSATLAGDTVGSLTVGQGGTGYTSTPTVTIAPPTTAGGVRATATATVSGDSITGFTITNPGSGYTAAPAVTISAPASGPQGTATAHLALGLTQQIATISAGSTGFTRAYFPYFNGLVIVPGDNTQSVSASYQ